MYKPVERPGVSSEALYEQYLVPVFQYISHRVNDTRTAEDLTLGVLKKAFSGVKDILRNEENLSIYVFTLAWKAVQSHGKAEVAEDCSEGGQFHECLSRLSPPEQDIMALKLCSGLDNRCLGRVLGLSESEVGQHISRALVRMNGNI